MPKYIVTNDYSIEIYGRHVKCIIIKTPNGPFRQVQINFIGKRPLSMIQDAFIPIVTDLRREIKSLRQVAPIYEVIFKDIERNYPKLKI
jgi:hypothetical protein